MKEIKQFSDAFLAKLELVFVNDMLKDDFKHKSADFQFMIDVLTEINVRANAELAKSY